MRNSFHYYSTTDNSHEESLSLFIHAPCKLQHHRRHPLPIHLHCLPSIIVDQLLDHPSRILNHFIILLLLPPLLLVEVLIRSWRQTEQTNVVETPLRIRYCLGDFFKIIYLSELVLFWIPFLQSRKNKGSSYATPPTYLLSSTLDHHERLPL